MARVGVVPAAQIQAHPTKSLRASDHLFSSKDEAQRVMNEYYGNPRLKDLQAKIEEALEHAYRAGKQAGTVRKTRRR